MRHSASVAARVSAWGMGLAAGLALGCGDDGAPSATMDDIFETMVVLLPAGVDAGRFADPSSRVEIQKQLDRLAILSGQLSHHERSDEATFGYLSRSLASEAAAMRTRFAEGRTEAARGRLLASVQTCVQCHSLQPSAIRFRMADRLLEQAELQSLLPHERALLHVLARRMSEALALWEALLADPAVPASQLEGAGVVRAYLSVAIRVRRDLDRARETLSAFALRPDVDRRLAELLRSWIGALALLEPVASAPPSLARARALAEQADALARWPAEDAGLVYDLLASSILIDLLGAATGPRGNADTIAEAYYWLGKVEARSLDPRAAAQSELHLEAAIRADPKGPFAPPALALLEARTLTAFGGIAAPNLPADVRERIAGLRALVAAEGG